MHRRPRRHPSGECAATRALPAPVGFRRDREGREDAWRREPARAVGTPPHPGASSGDFYALAGDASRAVRVDSVGSLVRFGSYAVLCTQLMQTGLRFSLQTG